MTTTETTTTTPATFLAKHLSRMSISEQSLNLDEVGITLSPGIGNSTVMIRGSDEFYKYIHTSVLLWMTADRSVLTLSDGNTVLYGKGIDNIATVFQAVLKGDGIFTEKIIDRGDLVYDESLIVSFLDVKISDNTLFSQDQCNDIYNQLIAANKIPNGTLTMNTGDQMGIVIVIEGPWGVKITIYIKW